MKKHTGVVPPSAGPEIPTQPEPRPRRTIFEDSRFQAVVPRFAAAISRAAIELGDQDLVKELEEQSIVMPEPAVVRKLDEMKPGTVKAVIDQLRSDETIHMKKRELKGVLHVLRVIFQPESPTRKSR
jgi:hypothetical protein